MFKLRLYKRLKSLSVIICCFTVAALAAGCAKKTDVSSDNSAITPLRWYYIGEQSDDNASVFNKANEIIGGEINARVDFQVISMGDYNQKMKLKVSAGEDFDLCFTSDWCFDYFDNVQKGAFLPLDDLLDQKAPNVRNSIPEKVWKATRYNDKIYGVPNYQVAYRQPAYLFKKDLVDKYNLYEQIENAKTIGDFTPILQVIKDNEPDIIPSQLTPSSNMYNTGSNKKIYDYAIVDIPVLIDEDLNILTIAEGEPHNIALERYAISRDWNQRGFFHKDIGMNLDTNPLKREGKFFLMDDVSKPGLESDMKNRYGYEIIPKILSKPIMSRGSISATLTSISRTSRNKEKAMELIEILNTNKELYNLLCFGLEDIHYKKTGDDRIDIINGSQYKAYAWVMGSQFNTYRLPGQAEGIWEETKKLNMEAIESPLLNFHVSIDNIKTEISNVKTVQNQFKSALNAGLLENYQEVFEEMNTKIESDLGIIIKDLERQIEGYKKNTGS